MTGFSKIEMRLTIPGHMGYLSIAMGFISECTKKFGFEKKDQNKTCLASEEALVNIFLNALMTKQPNQSQTGFSGLFPMKMPLRSPGAATTPMDIPMMPIFIILNSCGIMLGTTHSNVNFKGLTGETGYKDSDHLSFLPLKAPVRQIFPPARYKNLIDEIFGKLFPGGAGKSVAPKKAFPEPDTNGTRLAFSRTGNYNGL